MLAGSIAQPGGKVADHVITIRCISVICYFLVFVDARKDAGLASHCNQSAEECFA